MMPRSRINTHTLVSTAITRKECTPEDGMKKSNIAQWETSRYVNLCLGFSTPIAEPIAFAFPMGSGFVYERQFVLYRPLLVEGGGLLMIPVIWRSYDRFDSDWWQRGLGAGTWIRRFGLRYSS